MAGSGSVAAAPRRTVAVDLPRPRGRFRRAVLVVLVFVLVAVCWELLKWLAGDPWRINGLGLSIQHNPPFRWRLVSDLSLPHVWDIGAAFTQPIASGEPLGASLVGAALYTLRTAAIGFAAGAALGLLIGIVFVHSRLLERALVPWVVASQTVPIIAIAPIVVVALGASFVSVAVIATYLTFFPVVIASVRGLRAFDPRAGELMRSYAATPRQVLWRLRLPASVPYLFGALRIAAAASVVGTIIGELPSGIPQGLGSAILNYNQYYVTAPQRMWATIAVCTLSGLVFVGLVALAERILTSGRYRPAPAL
ncbi:MAG: ABC transporter permease [Chloroflexota bacterium]